jgi:hypothetical protein
LRSRALNDLRLARLKLKKPVRENLPSVNLEAMAACRLIAERREQFPELGSGKGQRRFQFGAPNRERHLKRLESIALVLMSICSHMDVVSLRSGRTRRDGSCDAIRVHKPRRRPGRKFVDHREQSSIEAETGRGHTAVTSALRDLVDAGYLERHPKHEDYEDEATGERRWKSFPTVYVVTKTCFARLGIDLEYLEEQRKAAYKRGQQLPEPLVDVRKRRAYQQMVRAQAKAAKRVTAGKSTTWTPADEAYRQKVLQQAARLKKRE